MDMLPPKSVFFSKELTEYNLLLFQHEAGRAAFEDARKQMGNIKEKIAARTENITNIKENIEKKKDELSEERKIEQVRYFSILFNFIKFHPLLVSNLEAFLQECIKQQEELMPLEQAAREKLAELKSVMDSERSQGSVLKAILQAKQSNQIEGIYGRMGDLGAIDGEYPLSK